jgi:cell division protein FtsQ
VADSAVRTRTDPRISRRRKAVARSKKRRTITRLLVVAGLALAVWLAFFSPLLAVREIRLAGATHTTAGDVERVVGLDSSDNLLLLSTDEVTEAVLKLPWVKAVDVDRKLPGTVKLTVIEREPALTVALGEERYLIDRRGRVLAEGQTAAGLPVLAGLEVESPVPGQRLESTELKTALAAFSSMPRSLRRDVRALFAPTVERITFQMSDGIQVRYGAAEEMTSKNEVLQVLLGRLRRQSSTPVYVDVRVPEAPAVSPLAEETTESGTSGLDP